MTSDNDAAPPRTRPRHRSNRHTHRRHRPPAGLERAAITGRISERPSPDADQPSAGLEVIAPRGTAIEPT